MVFNLGLGFFFTVNPLEASAIARSTVVRQVCIGFGLTAETSF